MHTSVDLSEYIRREDACAACKEPWTEETDEVDFMQLLLVMVPHSMHHFDKDTSQEVNTSEERMHVLLVKSHGLKKQMKWISCSYCW